MTPLIASLLLSVACAVSVPPGQEPDGPQADAALEVVDRVSLWRIGKVDGSCEEFALGPPEYGEFQERFPDGVHVDANDEDAHESWSAIHPGPRDWWAEGGTHPFQIDFQLEEPRDSLLLLWLTEVHDGSPPKLVVSARGERVERQLEPGGGEIVSHSTHGARQLGLLIPSTMLTAGANRLTLSVEEGSWLAYDALGLDAFTGELPPASLKVLRVRSLPVVTHEGQQLVRVLVRNGGRTADTRAVIHSPSGEPLQHEFSVPGFSERWITFELPEVAEPTPHEIALHARGAAQPVATSVTLEPPRHLEVHVMLGVHTDIGYTDLPEHTARIHLENLELMLEYCDRTEDWPQESRPTYTIETGWQLDQFIEQADPALVEQLKGRIAEGRVALNPLFLNTLTGMNSPEALFRLREFADEIERELGGDCRGASQTDTPSYSWSLCSLLANTGVRHLSTALNQHRAWFERNTEIVPPFYWEAPDGKRVLTWFSYQYGQYEYGLTGDVEDTLETLPAYLERRFPAQSYPWDMLLMHCYYADNRPLTFEPAPLIREWNERFRWPKLRGSTIAQFLSRFEERHGERIPVQRGDWGTYWEDGIGSSALATAANARNQAAADQATRLATLATAVGGHTYPKDELRAIWDDVQMYNEHTWGHAQSISDPDAEIVREHWKFKKSCTTRPVPMIQAATAEALAALAALPSTAAHPALCVWNTLSWPRTGPVLARVHHDGDFQLVDGATGTEVPWQRTGSEGEIVFIARHVPSLGYRLYELRPSPSAENPSGSSLADGHLSTPHYDVWFDTQRGGARSIVDLASGRQLVDVEAPYRMGQLIRDEGEPPHHVRHLARDIELEAFRRGPVVSTLTYAGQAPSCKRVEWTWSFYDELDRIDLCVTIDKQEENDKEAVYVAFPFAAKRPTLSLETAFSSFVPERDQLSGANRDWYTTVGAVSISGDSGSILWAPRDAPLVQFGDVQIGEAQAHLDLERPTILSYVMNNYWETNYRAGQEPGEHVFLYSFTASEGPATPLDSHRFGQELQQPLLAFGLPANHQGATDDPVRSLVTVEPAAYALIGMRRTRDGQGTLLRLLQLDQTESLPRLGGIFGDLKPAYVDGVEHPLEDPETPRMFRLVNLRLKR